MKGGWRSTLFVLGCLALGPVASPAHAQTQRYSEEVVTLWIRSGVSPERIKQQVADRGLSFLVNTAAETRLRAAGASDDLIVALRRAPQPQAPLSKPTTGQADIASSAGDAPETPSIRRAFAEGATLVGGATAQDDAWPFRLKVTSFNESTGDWIGELEWITLSSLHRIDGALVGTRVTFKETAAIRRGHAVLGCVYHLSPDQAGRRLTGRWGSCSGRRDSGEVWLEVPAAQPAAAEDARPSAEQRADPGNAETNTTVIGTWEGTVTQPELPNNPYPIVLTLTETSSGPHVGSAEFPTLGCRYSLTSIERTDRALRVRLNRERGSRGSCVNGTNLQLTLNQAGNLILEAFYPDGRSWVRSVLTRTAQPVASRPETPGDKRAEEPAAVSIAGTWHGSASDNSGSGTLTLILSVNGANVTGTSSATDSKTGTSVSGTVGGTIRDNTFEGQLTFTYGRCRITTRFTARLFGSSMSGTYAGRNTCTGPVTDGRFDLTPTPAAGRTPSLQPGEATALAARSGEKRMSIGDEAVIVLDSNVWSEKIVPPSANFCFQLVGRNETITHLAVQLEANGSVMPWSEFRTRTSTLPYEKGLRFRGSTRDSVVLRTVRC